MVNYLDWSLNVKQLKNFFFNFLLCRRACEILVLNQGSNLQSPALKVWNPSQWTTREVPNVKQLCIPEINPTWSPCIILLLYCWIPFPNALLRNFCICVHAWYRSINFFFGLPLSGFRIRMMLTTQKELSSDLSSFIFWKSFSKIGKISSINM